MTSTTRRLYNINGTVTGLKVGETDNTRTPYVQFVLVHDTPGRDGAVKKTPVDAYGKAALKMIDGGFAHDGAKIRVAGIYSDESRTNKDTGKSFRLTIFLLVHCETPKTPAERATLRAAKKAQAAELPAAA